MVVWAIWAAAGLSVAWFFLHVLVGGRQISRPLRTAEGVPHEVMATMVMCWNMVSAVLALMAGLFVMAAFWGAPFVIAGSLLAGAVALGGIATRYQLATTFRVIPQGWLFVPIAALGCYALLG